MERVWQISGDGPGFPETEGSADVLQGGQKAASDFVDCLSACTWASCSQLWSQCTKHQTVREHVLH